MFLGVYVRVFPEEVSISFGRLSKAGGPPTMGEHHSTHGEPAWKEQKAEEWRISWDVGLVPLDWDLCHQLPLSSGFQTQTTSTLSTFLGFYLAASRS